MHRFFSPDSDFSNPIIKIIDRNEIHHLRRVLRLKKDDAVCLFNGGGEEATGNILSINNNAAEIKIESTKKKSSRDKKTSLILACAIPKKAKFEQIIEKCTELGVDEIIPLKTKRTEFHMDKNKEKKKALRYQTVAINASKQSKRTIIPIIHPITKFSDVLKSIDKNVAAFIPCLLGKRKKLCDVFKTNSTYKKIVFFIGPEGDFTPQEIESALSAGCIPVSLGETVLKVDTAAISVIAFANFLS